MRSEGFPIYLDTIGTIGVAAVSGLFSGILTAVMTNAICALFNPNAIYFGFLNALIAIVTVIFVRKISFKKIWRNILFTVLLAAFCGTVSTLIYWNLLNGVRFAMRSETVVLFADTLRIPLFWAYLSYNILINILDKGLAILIAWGLVTIIPDRILADYEKGSWKQRPLSDEEIVVLKKWSKGAKRLMRTRSTMTILATSLILVAVTGWSGIRLYFDSAKEEMTTDAHNCLILASNLLDKKRFDGYMEFGESAPGYKEAEKLLQRIKDNYDSVENMYFVEINADDQMIIFNLDRGLGDMGGYGTRIKYDEYTTPYVQALLKGESIEPIDRKTIKTWTRSVYHPIRDENGKCICYGVADISITYMADYMKQFMIRSILIFLGFFILVVAHNLWITNVTMVYPIRSMAKSVDDFSESGYEQTQMDSSIRNIRALDIHTQDEIEKLYNSICRMTVNLSEQMRDLRRLSETTAKMQDGLIVTMADMVENRDSDTGAHIQKTASYVKIIVEGLKEKGYYPEKITPKFMSDVVRSAPLHDIGKINIPDGILNKPGKLTPEEFEIMKTHTTAGKRIMEDAISTVKGENYLKEARNMAAYHHERWDGKGYPEGLHGEVIPLSARIMAVADVFDALTSPRVYKPAFPLEKALQIIEEGSGSQFDPKCVEVFMQSLPEVKVILKKYNRDL